jgi:hypothetical protein
MHFTDNASSIPPKYREKVLEEARQNNPVQPSLAVTASPHQNEILPQGVKQKNNARVNTGEAITANRFLPPRPVINPPTFVHNQNNIEKTFAAALAPLAGFMFFWIMICLSLFIVWILTLVDIPSVPI